MADTAVADTPKKPQAEMSLAELTDDIVRSAIERGASTLRLKVVVQAEDHSRFFVAYEKIGSGPFMEVHRSQEAMASPVIGRIKHFAGLNCVVHNEVQVGDWVFEISPVAVKGLRVLTFPGLDAPDEMVISVTNIP